MTHLSLGFLPQQVRRLGSVTFSVYADQYPPPRSRRMTDSISFYTLKAGLMYLGLTPFPISTRNSAIAIAHLVTKTGVKQMFVSADPAMQRLARETNELLAKDGKEFELLPMPTFEDMYGPGGDEALVSMGKVSPDKTCIILHSSGESHVSRRAEDMSTQRVRMLSLSMQDPRPSRSPLSSSTRTLGSGARSYVCRRSRASDEIRDS